MKTKIGKREYESRQSATMERVANDFSSAVFLSISFTGSIVTPVVWGSHPSHQCPLFFCKALDLPAEPRKWLRTGDSKTKQTSRKLNTRDASHFDFPKCVLYFWHVLTSLQVMDFRSQVLNALSSSEYSGSTRSTHPRKEILHRNVTERGPLEYLDPKPPSLPALPRLRKKQTQDLCRSVRKWTA